MSTRSLTKVIQQYNYKDEKNKRQKSESVLTNIYRHHDGYLEGHGKDLAEFLKDIHFGNATPGEKSHITKDTGCLAAQLVAYLKKKLPGDIFLYPIDAKDCWQVYEYNIRVDEDKLTIQMEIYDVNQKKIIFKGTSAELLEKLGIKKEEPEADEKTEKDWTEPTHLNEQDRKDLKEIQRLYEAGKFKEALNYASQRDTVIREEIPSDIWKEMGGLLTASGEEELKKIREQRKSKSKKRGISK